MRDNRLGRRGLVIRPRVMVIPGWRDGPGVSGTLSLSEGGVIESRTVIFDGPASEVGIERERRLGLRFRFMTAGRWVGDECLDEVGDGRDDGEGGILIARGVASSSEEINGGVDKSVFSDKRIFLFSPITPPLKG